jgi:hypothetical protein
MSLVMLLAIGDFYKRDCGVEQRDRDELESERIR